MIHDTGEEYAERVAEILDVDINQVKDYKNILWSNYHTYVPAKITAKQIEREWEK